MARKRTQHVALLEKKLSSRCVDYDQKCPSAEGLFMSNARECMKRLKIKNKTTAEMLSCDL